MPRPAKAKDQQKGNGAALGFEAKLWQAVGIKSVRAKMRVAVKRILKKHGYPPDKQEKAVQTVIEQAEVLCTVTD